MVRASGPLVGFSSVLVTSLRQLAPVTSRTVIINVNTNLVATRAVLSAIEVVGDPVLVVNVKPTAEGRAAFHRLMATYDFDLIETSTQEEHGTNLNWVFSNLTDTYLLLVDSDAEVLEASFVDWMRARCRHPGAFGAGFTWGPFYLPAEWGAPEGLMLYMERPWVPCTMFKRAPVAEALRGGHSFQHKTHPNEVAIHPRISRFLAARWGPPWEVAHSERFNRLPARLRRRMGTCRLDWLDVTRRSYHGLRPSVAIYDTAAALYQHLRYEEGLLFAGIPVELLNGEVHHYSGVTRYALLGPTLLDTDEKTIEGEVIARLADRYGYDWHAD